MTPHDSKYNAVIGGPHESFQYMYQQQQFGGMATIFVNLTQQLENNQNFGPPKIRKPMMTNEEMLFAQKYKDWGIENFGPVVSDFYEQLEQEKEKPNLVSENGVDAGFVAEVDHAPEVLLVQPVSDIPETFLSTASRIQDSKFTHHMLRNSIF